MKIRQIVLLILFFYTTSYAGNTKNDLIVIENKKVFFIDSKQGYEYLQNSDFVKNLTNLDISIRMKEDYSENNIQEVKEIYLRFLRKQIKDWSKREKKYLKGKLNKVYEQMFSFSPNIIPDSLYLIRSSGDQEFNAFYTVNNAIVFPNIISTSANIFPWLPYFSNFIEKKIIHETFHVFSTNNENIRLSLYKLFGFEPIENLILPDTIKNKLITNPDDKGINYKIELTDSLTSRTKTYCLLIMSKYPRWVGYKDFSARINVMLDYLDPCLLEIEEQNEAWFAVLDSNNRPITIPVNDSAELQQKVKIMVNALQSPEEIVTKSYVIMMKSLIKNEEPDDQTLEALTRLNEMFKIVNSSSDDNNY